MKIKWNWGTKLAIAMILFMTLFLVLVYQTTKHGVMLVEKDYYPKGLKYQDRLDEIENAMPIAAELKIYQSTDEVIITFPGIVPDTGSIVFYRPSDNTLDKTFVLGNDSIGELTFPKSAFSNGKYLIKIFWRSKGKGYYIERPFYFN